MGNTFREDKADHCGICLRHKSEAKLFKEKNTGLLVYDRCRNDQAVIETMGFETL